MLTAILFVVLIPLPAAGPLRAPFESPLRLRNPNPGAGDAFGWSVAGAGSMVLIGAPFSDIGPAKDAGAAYLFDARTAELLQTFQNPARGEGDNFAWSVAFVGNHILIGAPGASIGTASQAGAAYLFDSTKGTPLQTFKSPAPRAGVKFGYSVAGVGERVVIGAPYDDAAAENAGAAYLFDLAASAGVPAFPDPPPRPNDLFGWAVGGLGNVVVVGAPGANAGEAAGAGAVHLFDSTTGALRRTISNPAPRPFSQFGWSVAAAGNALLVGTKVGGAGGEGAGETPPQVAYLLDPGRLESVSSTFGNPASAPGDQFGYSVAGVGNNVLIGAPSDDTEGTDTGAAYLFDGASGFLLHTFLKPNPNNSDLFGWSTAGAHSDIVIGAPGDDSSASVQNAGAAYLFPAISLPTSLNEARTVTSYATQTVTNTVSATATFTETRLVPTPVVPAETAYALIGVPLFLGVWVAFRRRNKRPTRARRVAVTSS